MRHLTFTKTTAPITTYRGHVETVTGHLSKDGVWFIYQHNARYVICHVPTQRLAGNQSISKLNRAKRYVNILINVFDSVNFSVINTDAEMSSVMVEHVQTLARAKTIFVASRRLAEQNCSVVDACTQLAVI